MDNKGELRGFGMVSSWKSGLAGVKNRVRAFGMGAGGQGAGQGAGSQGAGQGAGCGQGPVLGLGQARGQVRRIRRGVGALVEAMEGRQMLSAVPAWLNAYGSTAADGDFFSSNSLYDVVTDGANNVYVAGVFRGTVDFDFGAGTKSLTSTYGLGDGYVAKYTADGALSWIAQFAGSGVVGEFDGSSGRALSVDSSGNLYVAGGFAGSMSVDFGSGAKVLTSTGATDVFVAKLSTAGALSYIKAFSGGAGSENVYQFVGSTDSGITLLGVSTGGVDLDVNAGTVNLAAPASGGVSFVAHYDTSMNYQWFVATRGTGAAGTSNFSGADMAAGTSTLVVSANTKGPGEVVSSAGLLGNITATETGMQTLVVSMNLASGSPVVNWGSSIVSTDLTSSGPVSVDKDGNVYLGMSIRGKADLDGGAGVVMLDTGTAFSPVIVSMNKAGAYRWSATTGLDGIGEVRDMAVRTDPTNASKTQLVAVGTFEGRAQFDPAQTIEGIRETETPAGFVWYMTSEGAYVDAGGLYANPNGVGSSPTGNADVRAFALVNGSDALVLGGVFTGKVDFDASTGTKFVDSVSDGFTSDVFFGRFAHTGTADAKNDSMVTAPGISVTGLGVTITNNDVTPSAGDGTDFGNFTVGGTALLRTFTVTNTGTAALTLTGLTRPGGFGLADALSTTLAAGASDTFTLSFGPAGAGTFTGNVSFTTNVTGSETFTFKITGVAAEPTTPEVLGPTFDDGARLDWFNTYTIDAYTAGKDGFNQMYAQGSQFDAAGNLYVVARFIGKIDMDPGAGVAQVASGASVSNVLAKYTGEGALVWAKVIRTEDMAGGLGTNSGVYIAGFDDEGNVLLAGYLRNKVTFGEDGASPIVLTVPGDPETFTAHSFIARYSGAGEVQFAKMIASTGAGNLASVATVSADGTRLAIAGSISADATVDLDPGVGTVNVPASTMNQSFVALYDTDGNYLTHMVAGATAAGSNPSVTDLAFDAGNNLFISGAAYKSGALKSASGTVLADLTNDPVLAQTAGYVVKLDSSKSAPALAWLKMFKSDTGSATANVEVDGAGNAYVGLVFSGTVDLDPGAGVISASSGGTSMQAPGVVSLDAVGGLRWGKAAQVTQGAGGNGSVQANVRLYTNPEKANDVTVVTFGRAISSGTTTAVLNFDPALGAEGKLNLDVKTGTGYVWRADGDTGGFLSVSGLYSTRAGANQSDVVPGAGAVDSARGVLALTGYISAGTGDLDPDTATAFVPAVGNMTGFTAVYDVKDGGIVPVDGVEFHVTGNGVHIEINDTTPATGDGTNFGTVNQGAGLVTKTFLVSNIGKGTLTLGPVTLPAGFTLTEGLSTTIAAGKTDTFKVTMDTGVAGKYAGDIAFESNMPGQELFKFQIAGTVQAVTSPGVAVTFGATGVADGDTTPSGGEGTLYASAKQGATGGTSTFTITNTGTANLTIGAITVPSGFVLVDGFTGTIGAGKSQTIVVGLKTTTVGSFAGDVSIVTNVTGRNPYNFKVQGVVTGEAAQADLVVSSKAGDVSNGMGAGAGTDFGDTTFVGSTASVLVFTVTNTGLATMKTSGLTLPAGVKIVDGLLASIAPGKSDTFSIAMNTTKAQTVTGIVSFKTNVPGDELFKFSVEGTVLAHKLAGGTFTLTSKSLAVDKTFYDEKGNKVVFSLTGGGQVQVEQSESGQLLSLTATGTDAKSAISVTVTKDAKVAGSTGVTTIGSIDIQGALSAFTGAAVNVTGGFNGDGLIKAVTLNDLVGTSQQSVKIGGTWSDKVTMTFGRLQDVSISTNAMVTAFKALDWLDIAGSAQDFLSAGTLGSLTISGRAENKVTKATRLNGDLFADITLLGVVGAGAKLPGLSVSVAGSTSGAWDLNGVALKGATIKGDVAGGQWSSDAGFGSITVGGDVLSLTLDTDKNLTSLKAGEVLGADFKVGGTIGSITAVDWKDGSIFAGAIGKLTTTGRAATKALPAVAGDFSGSLTVVGVSSSATSKTVGAISIKGSVRGDAGDGPADWQFTGGVGSISIGEEVTDLHVTTRTKGDSKGNVGHVGSFKVGRGVYDSELDVTGKLGAVSAAWIHDTQVKATGDIASFTTISEASSTQVTSQGAIGAVTVGSWHGGGITADKVASITTRLAPGVKLVSDGGGAPNPANGTTFMGNVTITGEGVAATAQVLGSVNILGLLSDSVWMIHGKTGAISVGSTSGGSVSIEGELTSFISKRIMAHTTVHTTGGLGAVKAMAFDHVTLEAAKIASVTATGQTATKTLPGVAGNFVGNVVVSGAGVGSKLQALGTVSIAGMMATSTWSIGGNSGAVTVGAIIDSAFFVGVNLPASVDGLPDSKSDFKVLDAKTGALSTLAGFTVTGKAVGAGEISFTRSSVAAGNFTNVSLKLVDLAELNVNGFRAGAKIGAFSRLTGLPKPNDVVKVSNKTLAGVYDPAGGSGAVGYSLRIV